MKLKTTIFSAIAAIALGSAASAATFTFTEGDRNQILGSTKVIENGSGTGDTAVYDLGLTLGSGDVIDIHGRIIGKEDTYLFESNTDFKVTWIFDGYTTDEDGFVADSGFVATPLGSESAPAVLNMSGNGFDEDGVDTPFFTDITAALGGELKVFTTKFTAGSYIFSVDGLGGGKIDSLYDVRIASVPLPSGALLLLSGLGGLAIGRRRRG